MGKNLPEPQIASENWELVVTTFGNGFHGRRRKMAKCLTYGLFSGDPVAGWLLISALEGPSVASPWPGNCPWSLMLGVRAPGPSPAVSELRAGLTEAVHRVDELPGGPVLSWTGGRLGHQSHKDSTFPRSPGLHPLGLGITMHHLILSLRVTSGRLGRGTRTSFFLEWGVIRLGSPTGHTEPAAEDREAPGLTPLPAVYVSLIVFPQDMVGKGWFPQGSCCHPASSLMRRALPGHETPHNHVFMADTGARTTSSICCHECSDASGLTTDSDNYFK